MLALQPASLCWLKGKSAAGKRAVLVLNCFKMQFSTVVQSLAYVGRINVHSHLALLTQHVAPCDLGLSVLLLSHWNILQGFARNEHLRRLKSNWNNHYFDSFFFCKDECVCNDVASFWYYRSRLDISSNTDKVTAKVRWMILKCLSLSQSCLKSDFSTLVTQHWVSANNIDLKTKYAEYQKFDLFDVFLLSK